MKTLRKPGKKNLLEFIGVFRQINSTVVQTKIINVAELTEAQTSAIDLGNFIEERYGEDATNGIIKDLEEYCENLYKLSLAEDDKTVASIARRISMLLNRVEYEIKNSLPQDKKIVVFLPYKASMWDSLESIYLAAAEDDRCEAYVVPIPYYDRKPDMTLGQFHYEGELYPDNIPITSYEEFDLAMVRPDIAYIHNPYDDWNTVTSVHPAFYSRELKKHVGTLVYVPYFVSGDSISPNMCQSPGVVNADYVIVESEYIKKQYEKNYPGENLPEGKFLPLGSPKFDKVIRAKKENYPLPPKWNEIVQGKKIIAYITSLGAYMQNSEHIIDKLKDVLRQFKERRDVALWWRPHPLTEATLSSLMPGLVEEYRKIKEQYIAEGWGIYDDTPDMDRAIVWSDAYYGDRSSVDVLYRATGKPIMWEDFRNIPYPDGSKQEDFLLWPQDMLIDGDGLWLVHGKMSILVKYSLRRKKVELVERIPGPPLYCLAPYRGMCLENGRLYILPARAKDMVRYDIESKEFKLIEIPERHACDGPILFNEVYKYGGRMYCIPMYYPYILTFDLNTETFEIKLNHLEEARALVAKVNYLNCTCCVGETGFAGVWTGSNLLLLYNMESDDYEITTIGEEDASYNSVVVKGDRAYLCDSRKHSILEYSINERKVKKVVTIPSKVAGVGTMATGEIILLSLDSADIVVLSPETYQARIFASMPERLGAVSYYYRHCLIKNKERVSYLYDRSNCSLRTISDKGCSLESTVDITAIKKELEKIIYGDGNCTVMEEYGANYIEGLVKRLNGYRRENVGEVNDDGTRIHKFMMR